MRKSLLAGAAFGLLGALTVGPVAFADPSGEGVTSIGPEVDSVKCDGGSITRTITGWVNHPTDEPDVIIFHEAWVYSNGEGATWRYIDTGVIKHWMRDGDHFVSLSGRSVNVGPDGTGWIGRWVNNLTTDEVTWFGHGGDEIDQLACSVLASS